MSDEMVTIVAPAPPAEADALFEGWKASHAIPDDDPRLDLVVVDLIRSSSKTTLKQYRAPVSVVVALEE